VHFVYEEKIVTPEALAYLASEEGMALLAYAATLPSDRLTRLQNLRKRTAPETAASVVSLLELRYRARAKFSDADLMFFTAEGLEQASSEAVARWRAAQFPANIALLDACCGIGSDARAFVKSRRVVAIDASPTTVFCAALNLKEAECRIACADVTRLDLKHFASNGINAAFFDPSRRMTNAFGNRVRAASAEDYSPPLSFFSLLAKHFAYTAAKVSPAIADETLQSLGVGVEFVSHRGECKEAILWSEAFGRVPRPMFVPEPRYTATVLQSDGTSQTLTASGVPLLPVSAPQQFLIEPDPAVIRAHLTAELAELMDAAPLESGIAYLTAETFQPTVFADTYRIQATCAMDKKAIQRELRTLNGRLTAIKKRGVEAEPEVWRIQIKDVGETPYILILTRSQGKRIALFCTPVPENKEAMNR